MNKTILKRIIISLFVFSFFILPSWALAEDPSKTEYGLTDTFKDPNAKVLQQNISVSGMAGKVIGAGLAFLTVAFLLLMIYGGVLWMISRGDETKAKKAKELIIGAVIGLLIVLSAYALTLFVSGALITSGTSE